MTWLQPDFKIDAGGYDLIYLIRDRLLSLQIIDRVALAADTLTLILDDRNRRINFPKKGITLKVSLGWRNGKLTRMGTYVVDEVEMSGPPHTLTVRAKSADISCKSISLRSQSWENSTVSNIIKGIAARNEWEAVCPIETQVEHVDQLNESDLNFVSRLADTYGATATVKNGRLIFVPRGEYISAKGDRMPLVTITPVMITKYRMIFPNRYSVAVVTAKSLDKDTGDTLGWEVENKNVAEATSESAYTGQVLLPDAETAKSVAQAKLNDLNRNTAKGYLEMPGTTDISVEKEIKLEGFKVGIDGSYLVESVTHNFNSNSWTTVVEFSSDNKGKAKLGEQPGKEGLLWPVDDKSEK